ncbi:MAG TPA: TIGR01777 family oxidoreductase [Conexibacter sp.]|jgi:hypothetical protein
MQVTLTGATGLIGRKLVAALLRRGDELTVLTRKPGNAQVRLGGRVDAVAWDPLSEPAPAAALSGRDGVIHLAGEPVAQRWNDASRERILASRERGTANLVEGLRAADPRPSVLVSASAVGYYGPCGSEEVNEQTPPGRDFLADVCAAWEREAKAAEQLGMRVVTIRTGLVLDPDGGALAKMLPPFKLGVGGPVAGGRQYMPWIHVDDLVGLYLAALDSDDWSGPVNATAPTPATNADFSKALGAALNRPAIAPVPRLAMKLLYGDMEQIVTTGQRAVPTRALALGYRFRHPQLDEALRAAVG